MQEEYMEERQTGQKEEHNEIIYRRWQMVLLTVVQYVFDVVMTPIRSLVFGPSERQSLSNRLQQISEKGERKQEKKETEKTPKEEKEKDEPQEKKPETKEPSIAEKRYKMQEAGKILEQVHARLESGQNASVFFLRSNENGEIINTVRQIDELTIKDFEKSLAASRNINTSGSWRDFDKLEAGIYAVMTKTQMDIINGTFINDVEHDIATRNGVYHISVSPVFEKNKSGIPVLNDKSIKLMITRDGQEINKSFLPPFTQKLDNCINQCMREIGKEYNDEASIELTKNIKLSIKGQTVTVDASEKTQEFSLQSTDEIKRLKEFLQEEFTPEKAEAVAELVSMAFYPQEIVQPVDRYNHNSILDGQFHSNSENYAYIREADTHTDICFSQKGADGQETVHNLLSVTDMHQLTGEQLLETAEKYMALKGEPSYENPESSLHKINDYSLNLSVQQKNWQDISLPTVYSQNDAAALVDRLAVEVNEYATGMEYNGKQQFSEAVLTAFYYNHETDCMRAEVEATQMNYKSREFTIDIFSKNDSMYAVEISDKRFSGMNSCLSDALNENTDLTESLCYHLKNSDNIEEIEVDETIKEPQTGGFKEIPQESRQETDIIPQDSMEMDEPVEEYSDYTELTDDDIALLEEMLEEGDAYLDMEECL